MWALVCAVVVALLAVGSVETAQRFEERPQDRSVMINTNVTLKCVIRDRKGAVQWTKGGNTLGFNRTIPARPRYTMVGGVSGAVDEFNLRIVDVQLEDDDLYSCQALPLGQDAPLKADARLTVMAPPDNPFIENYSNNSQVEALYTDSSVVLMCVARDGRPAADLFWYRNGRRLTQNIQYSTDNPDSKRVTARSQIRIPITNYREENGKEYKCEARGHWTEPLKPTVVRLNILYPPGPPQLSGYNNESLHTNRTLRLTCVSEGGNPVGFLRWLRNNVPIGHQHTTVGNTARSTYDLDVKASDHKKVFTCEVTSNDKIAMAPLRSSYTLSVYFAPEFVRMEGNSDHVRVDTDITLICRTARSNPKASVTWYSGHSEVTSTQITETHQEHPEGGWITQSQYKFKALAGLHNRVIACQAVNSKYRDVVSATRTLNILYPPTGVNIRDLSKRNIEDVGGKTLNVNAGENKTLECVAQGGNPKAQLTWFKGNTRILDVFVPSNGPISKSLLDLHFQPDDNGAVYKCKANNNASTAPKVKEVTFSVSFPPTEVNILVSKNPASVGNLITLECQCSSSNPPARLTWTRNRRRLVGTDLPPENAENGGKKSMSKVTFRASPRDHNSEFICSARNERLDHIVKNAVTLQVKFKPQFDTDVLPTTIDMRDGQRKSINLTAIANPQVVSYQIWKDSTRMNPLPGHFNMSGGVLTISTVKKSDKGSYVVRASNTEGSTEFSFSAVVKYQATVSRISPAQSVDEGRDVSFVCKADAYPVVSNMFTWFREDFDMSRFIEKQEGIISTLTIRHLKREDAGKFKCTVDNRIGSPSHRNAELIVKFSPVIDKSPEWSRSAGRPGTDVTIYCHAAGAPQVDITWTRNNTQVRRNSKFDVDTTNDGPKYKSKLKIKSVTRDDYGAYVCTAINSKGSDSHSIALGGTTKPYPPYDIQAVNRTARSITILWKAGFNGGLSQSFRIRYKPVENSGYVFRDVQPYGALSYKLMGLQKNVEYEITVLAFNEKGKSMYPVPGITVKTLGIRGLQTRTSTKTKEVPADVMTSDLQGSDETPVIIILVVCIVGVFILTLNVGLILFFIRKRKKRLEGCSDTTSHTNTFELYGSANKTDPNLYPPAPSDDTRSYGTYDKSMDDFSDDYIRDYDAQCCSLGQANTTSAASSSSTTTIIPNIHPTSITTPPPSHKSKKVHFANVLEELASSKSVPLLTEIMPNVGTEGLHGISIEGRELLSLSAAYVIEKARREKAPNSPLPASEYPGSRPYSPSHKLAPHDSPRLLGGGHKMTTYVADDKPGRISPWSEDPYKRSTPTYRKGSYENGIPNGDVYEFKSARGKGMNELSERPTHRPPSRSGKTPPPPPVRSSSRCGTLGLGTGLTGSKSDILAEEADNDDRCRPSSRPPLPARNYLPMEIISSPTTPTSFTSPHSSPPPVPRYGPMPGSTSVLSPNIVPNPNYNGPISSFGSSNNGINHHGARTTTASINHHHHAPSSRTSPSSYNSNNYNSSSSNLHRPPPSPHNTVPAGSEFRGHLV